jgi:hypothetical protein
MFNFFLQWWYLGFLIDTKNENIVMDHQMINTEQFWFNQKLIFKRKLDVSERHECPRCEY